MEEAGAQGPLSPPPSPKQNLLNLSQYEFTDERQVMLLQYNPKYIKSTQSAVTMIFIRDQNPSFLQGGVISNNSLQLPTCSIEIDTKPIAQIVILPQHKIIDSIGQLMVDPKDKGFMRMVEGMPGFRKGTKEKQAKENHQVMEAYAKLRQKDMKVRKNVRRRIKALIKRRKTKGTEEAG